MLTPTSNSDSAKLFSATSNFSIIVKAATSVTIGDKTDFTTSGAEITGLSQAGLDKVNSADKIILKIPAIDGIKTIKKEAFSNKFNNKTVEVKIPDNIVEIGEAAFATNSAITAVKFGTTPSEQQVKDNWRKSFL